MSLAISGQTLHVYDVEHFLNPLKKKSMKKLARRWRRTRGDDDEDDDKLVLPTFDDIDSRPIDTQGSSSY